MSRSQTYQRKETDRLLSIAIQKKLHPEQRHQTLPSYSVRGETWMSSGSATPHLPSVRVDKAKISLPRCAGTGNADWKRDAD